MEYSIMTDINHCLISFCGQFLIQYPTANLLFSFSEQFLALFYFSSEQIWRFNPIFTNKINAIYSMIEKTATPERFRIF